MDSEKAVKIDVLISLADGTLAFHTVEVKPGEARKLLEAEKDPVVKHNLEKELRKKKMI